jgi:uncharacterized protein (DUF2249 family)
MCEATNNLSIEELDVRSLDLAQRHEKICERIDELAFGASFVLIKDHDPKPLYDQLETEYPNQFYWDYLENGPVVWRVEIGRRVKAALRAAIALDGRLGPS